jgi:hypothetical protein
MTRDDRPNSREREQTQPDGVAAHADDTARTDNTPVDGAGPNDSTRKAFNPWRFGFHTVSTEHRRELLEMQLPETPAERLFDPGALDSKPDTSGSAPPALSVDTDDESNDGSAARRADTLRLRRGPSLAHPLRLAAPWAAGAALIVIALLWLLSGESEPQRRAAAVVTQPPATLAPPQSRAAQPKVRTEPPSPALVPTGTGVMSDAPPEATKPDTGPKRQEARKAPKPTQVPAVAPTPPSTTATPPTPRANKSTTPNDDASPFGTWTAPPRD